MKAVRTVDSIQQERTAKGGGAFAAFTLEPPLASLPFGKHPIHQ